MPMSFRVDLCRYEPIRCDSTIRSGLVHTKTATYVEAQDRTVLTR